MDRTGESEAQQAEALRRRLYRPDASEEDRLRYAASVEPEPAQVPEAPRRRAGRTPVVLVTLATLVVAATGIAAVHAGTRPASRPLAATSAAPRPTTSAPSLVLTVNGATETAQPIRGTGSATVALDVSAISLSGGTISVLLTAVDERPVGWRALALETRRDWSEYTRVVESSPARDRLAATRPDVLDYTGDPPRWIRVQAAADAKWRLTVVAGS